MTIKEPHEATSVEGEIYICENGCISPLNRDSVLTLATYGDLMMDTIAAIDRHRQSRGRSNF